MGGSITASSVLPAARIGIRLLRRGAGAVERGGLENRCPSCGGPRVRIPPSPPTASPLLPLHLLPTQRPPGALAGRLAGYPDRATIDEDVLDPRGRRHRRLEGSTIGNGVRSEHRDVGISAGGQRSPAGEAKT